MLIRFSVENFMSFRQEVELSLIPGKAKHHADHVIGGKGTNALKSAVIYGANASGKSNLIKAMAFAKELIVDGTRAKDGIPTKPFRLDAVCAQKPSKFEFWLKHQGKSYIYGFLVDTQRVHEEWLYEATATTEKLLFERKTDTGGHTTVEFAHPKSRTAKERQFLEFTTLATRPNQLFLTQSIESNVKHFADVYKWFAEVLVLIFPESRNFALEVGFMNDEDFKIAFQNFLRLFDVGVSGVDLTDSNLEDMGIIPEDFRDQVINGLGSEDRATVLDPISGRNFLFVRDHDAVKMLELRTLHQAVGEENVVQFEVSEESDGTQRLFHIIPALMGLLAHEKVYVIDELDRSLHPHISRSILELFLGNPVEHNSQLIVTTHEASLLDLELLRRDEIWFMEKDPNGQSNLYSLEEFAPRADKDIRKGYLQGRFGAIPLVPNVQNLEWVEHA